MKRAMVLITALLALVALSVAQTPTGTVRGKVNDEQGKPIAGATVSFKNAENGRKYDLKTNAKGEYIQVGMQLGEYNATLIGPDGKPIFSLNGIRPDPNKDTVVDFDLAKERAAAEAQANAPQTAGGTAGNAAGQPERRPSEEQKKEMAKIDQENTKIRSLNEMLKQADAAKAANNLDQAITIMQQATVQGPDKELLWIKLAEYQSAGGKFADAVPSYQKAIALVAALPPEKQDKMKLAALHNNLGQALGKTGKPQDAIQEYTSAAQVNPANAAQYYYNLGAVLTNPGHTDEANTAFDKAIAADPNYADAYYQKGVNLLGKATVGKDGKMTAPDGTAEAFNKYLQLQPAGKYAQGAKELLGTIGAEIQTGYKTKKK
ncbi:MAG: carboxypeptidase regulatory-like domain-containing protein [Candidatus Koribacter versatilis]|uniref:Carboxypeptidase regulatory-like domain-containing protein n=1 Tax=Candidatus Korobacter versatilis TaxID=658062 RepID=A0A932EQ27_9BACT|nr:carboxypeptidase regulatory-like domain-containing protein [Candidatus Koribacter versatilis]